MSHLIYLLLFIIPLFSQEKNNTLKIEIKGMNSSKGDISLALYDKESDFPSITNTYRSKVQNAKDKTIVFEDLKSGTYAIAIYHDENGNGILDKNIFGVPTEKYGFSNNARGKFSYPAYNSACFSLTADRKISITLK
jgi:uncharacterized protein (DUF2141 family)